MHTYVRTHTNMLICTFVHVYKGIPLQAWTFRKGSGRLRLPEFLDSWHMKVERLSALHTDHIYSPPRTQEIPLVLISVRYLVDPRAIVRQEKFKSMKNSDDPIGNWTCDLAACNAVSQLTVPLCIPHTYKCAFSLILAELIFII
jgi:hypothetical protein